MLFRSHLVFFNLGVSDQSADLEGEELFPSMPPEASSVPSSSQIEAFCESNCVAGALSGDSLDDLPRFCSTECPEYLLPPEALEPDAVCVECPDEDCTPCYCENGECLHPGGGFVTFEGRPVYPDTCASCSPARVCKSFWWCDDD